MPKIERMQPPGMNVRMQGGKAAYSHVVTVTGPGKTIYVAGQLGRDADGNIVGDMRAQMEQTFKNLEACLKAAGATWADVIKTNTFVTDYEEFSKHSDVRMRYIGVASPTSTTKPICVRMLLSMPRSITPASADSTAIGTMSTMASGRDQLSYCAASTRNTSTTQSGKTKIAVLPASFC